MNDKKIDSYYEPSWKTSKIGDGVYATKFYVMQKQIDELQQENKQLKERLERIDNYLDKNYTMENQYWFDHIRDIVEDR